MRILPDIAKKTDFRRKALNPTSTGSTRWGLPTAWLMNHATGYWQSVAIPMLEDRVSRSTWGAFVFEMWDKSRSAGEEDSEMPTKRPGEEYPAGMPLRQDEIKAARNPRPKSGETGDYSRWDFSPHSGCKAPADGRNGGRNELVKLNGLHPLIKMHMARRGGHKGRRR